MAACNAADIAKVMAAVERLPPAQRRQARAFAEVVTPHGLCEILHAMRRWYSNQTGPIARRLLPHREALSAVMQLGTPVGSWRGFKIPRGEVRPELRPGAAMILPVSRNGNCSSWTTVRAKADRFSGATKTHVGVVVELIGGDGVRTFIAPPSHTLPWFDALYELAIGRSFRFTEAEFALCAEAVIVRVDAVKR